MIRLRTGLAALFSAIFVLALILLLPLRFVPPLAWSWRECQSNRRTSR